MTWRRTPSKYEGECHCGIDFMGEDFYLTIFYRVNHWGSPATWWEPAEGAEIEIDRILMQWDVPGEERPLFEATGTLLDDLAEHTRVNEAVQDDAANVDLDYDYEG